MKFRQLLTFVFVVCGVLSANAQIEDDATDVANGDSVSSNAASVSQETIGFGGKHNRIKMDYNFGWFISKILDKKGDSHRGLFGTGLSVSYEHVFRAGYGFGLHGILERSGSLIGGSKELITGYIGPSFVYAKSINSWTYGYSIGIGYGRYSLDSYRFYHEDRSGLGTLVQIEGEKRLTKWLGIGAGLRILNITVEKPEGFEGLRYGTGSLRFTIGPRFYF